MSYSYDEPREKTELRVHGKFPLKLMIEHARSVAYFYVEYGGHKIGMLQDKIGAAQSLYNNILNVLNLEGSVS